MKPVDATPNTKGSKKPSKRTIKRKRFKCKIKKEEPKSNPKDMCSWLVAHKDAPLKKVNKRSWVESKMKYPP
ncbi:hypothetical protein A2U01_0084123 [Trifolium medium]|uniref:Uncharacterized protein n=1 Tax=Trifolium medium TaxID=97028 RepID=A0A392TRV1_9FABA|nr:hypothetical protein [Trifolium medium]